MLSRPAAGALVALAIVMARGEGAVLAQPPPAPPAPAVAAPPAAPAPPPQAQPKGAVVVAVSPGAGPAARALAADVYREDDLRPSIDDATARVLAGDALPANAPPRLKDLADLRASIITALALAAPPPAAADGGAPPPAPSDLVGRRLLASLGTDLHAVIVIPVSADGGHPVARALRVATSAFERIEIGPAVDLGPDGARTYRWPGAVDTFHGLLIAPPEPLPAPVSPAGAALAPKVEGGPAAPAEPRPFYKSPWFWGSLGGAAVVGLSVFLISRATQSAGNVHLSGQVGP
jgi:hypothetical protein